MKTYLIVRRNHNNTEPFVCYTGYRGNCHTYSSIGYAQGDCNLLNKRHGREYIYTVEKLRIKKAKQLGYEVSYMPSYRVK